MAFDFSTMFSAATGKEAPSFMGPTQAQAQKKAPFTWAGLFSKATDIARASGVRMPMDTEIAQLTAKRKTLAGLQYQMDDITRQAVPRLAARRSEPASVAMAGTLKKTASQARYQATAAIRLIDAALADGKLAQEKMRYGTAALKPSATFFAKKAIADKAFSLAKNRLDLVVSTWHMMESRLMAVTPLPTSIAQATKSSLMDFGGTVSRGLVRTGVIVEEAAESTAKGAQSLAPYLKYAPYVLGGFAVLYGLQFLPRARRD